MMLQNEKASPKLSRLLFFQLRPTTTDVIQPNSDKHLEPNAGEMGTKEHPTFAKQHAGHVCDGDNAASVEPAEKVTSARIKGYPLSAHQHLKR